MNIYRHTVACATLLLVLFHVNSSMAEKLRPANAAEDRANTRYKAVMTHLLDQFLTCASPKFRSAAESSI
jgi:hypothetical protein